jgi:hypothetical protein
VAVAASGEGKVIAAQAARAAIQRALDNRFRETYRFRRYTFESHPQNRVLARVAKPHPDDLPPSLRGALATKQSIARQTRLADCFPQPSAPCAEPVARNDGLKISHFIGGNLGSLSV